MIFSSGTVSNGHKCLPDLSRGKMAGTDLDLSEQELKAGGKDVKLCGGGLVYLGLYCTRTECKWPCR